MRVFSILLFFLIHPLLIFALCLLDVDRCLAADKLPILSKQTAVITDRFGLSLVADIDLGLLPRASRGIIELTLVNNSSDAILIDRIRASCSCLSSLSLAKSIEPGQQGEFRFSLDTPNVAATREIRLSANLVSDEQSRDVRLAMKYLIEGVLAFESRLCVIELNENDQSQAFESQLFCTAPVIPEEIEIAADPVFKNVKFAINASDRKTVLSGSLPLNTFNGDEIAGRVSLKHAKTNQIASMDLILRKKSLARVSPSLITLRRNYSEQSLQGSAILHLDTAKDLMMDDNEPLIIDAESSDLSFQVTAKQLARGVYKMKISVSSVENSPPEALTGPINVTLCLRNMKQPVKLSTRLVIEK